MSGRYVVAQEPSNGAWRHYLSAWPRGDHGIPVFLPSRDQALVFDDEETARQAAARLDDRYRRVVRHDVEELP